MTKHKWAKEIKAWADGAEIESRYLGRYDDNDGWQHDKDPEWNENDWQFRVKSKHLNVPQQIEKAWNDAVAVVTPDNKVQLLKEVYVGDLLYKAQKQPTPQEPQYLYVYRGGLGSTIVLSEYSPDSGRVNIRDFSYIKKIKLEQDDAD